MVLIGLLSTDAAGQNQCFGLARGNCTGLWVSRFGYHHRLDDRSLGSHRFTWELGPNISYPQLGAGIGGALIAAFDEDGEAQFGAKTSGFRDWGFIGVDLGIGAYFLDTRKSGALTITASTAATVQDIVQVVLTIDAIDRGSAGSESRVYLGAVVRRSGSSVSPISALITLGSFVLAIALSN